MLPQPAAPRQREDSRSPLLPGPRHAATLRPLVSPVTRAALRSTGPRWVRRAASPNVHWPRQCPLAVWTRRFSD